MKLLIDLPGFAFTDALDLSQPLRFFFNDPERILLEFLDNAGCQ